MNLTTLPVFKRLGFKRLELHIAIHISRDFGPWFFQVVISYDWHPHEHCSFVESANEGKVKIKEDETLD